MFIRAQHVRALQAIAECSEEDGSIWAQAVSSAVRTGLNARMQGVAAKHLQLDIQQMTETLDALMFVMVEAANNKLSLDGLLTCVQRVVVCVADAGLCSVLTVVYNELYEHLCNTAALNLQPIDPQYTDCRWRLQAQVASRACREQCAAVSVHCVLSTTDHQQHQFQCKASTLQRVTQQLEAAVAAARTRHSIV